jgi:hypothetical protein
VTRRARFGVTLGGVTAGLGSATARTTVNGEAQYLDACVAETQVWLGDELTAYVAGADSPGELAEWVLAADAAAANGAANGAAHRLRTVAEVIELFDAAGQGTGARAWLREVSAQTREHGPAQLIRNARTEQELDDVRHAAARFLRHG